MPLCSLGVQRRYRAPRGSKTASRWIQPRHRRLRRKVSTLAFSNAAATSTHRPDAPIANFRCRECDLAFLPGAELLHEDEYVGARTTMTLRAKSVSNAASENRCLLATGTVRYGSVTVLIFTQAQNVGNAPRCAGGSYV